MKLHHRLIAVGALSALTVTAILFAHKDEEKPESSQPAEPAPERISLWNKNVDLDPQNPPATSESVISAPGQLIFNESET